MIPRRIRVWYALRKAKARSLADNTFTPAQIEAFAAQIKANKTSK